MEKLNHKEGFSSSSGAQSIAPESQAVHDELPTTPLVLHGLNGHALMQNPVEVVSGTQVWGEGGVGYVDQPYCDSCGDWLIPPAMRMSCHNCSFDLCMRCADA